MPEDGNSAPADDAGVEDLPSDSQTENDQADADVEDDSNNGDDSTDELGDGGDGQKPKQEPLHKNPRFKEIIQQNRELRKENAKLKELEESSKKPKVEADPDEEHGPRGIGAPKHSFKEAKEYTNIDSLYEDLYQAIKKDFEYEYEVQNQETTAAQAAYREKLVGIQTDIGDDSLADDFFAFLSEVTEKDMSVDPDVVFDVWLKAYNAGSFDKKEGPAEKPKQKKRPKISKSGKPTTKSNSKKPSIGKIRSTDYDELYDEYL